MRMRISETMVDVVRLVNPHNSNPLDFLYGGYMLRWLVDAATIAAMGVSGSGLVLGYLDRMHFVSPVKIGSVLVYRAWVLNVRKTSITTLVESYVKQGSEASLATIGRLIFVKVDASGKPVPVGVIIGGVEEWERTLLSYFEEWRRSIEPNLREERAEGELAPTTRLLVMPEAAVYGDLMYAGNLLYTLDQVAAISAFEYEPGVYVTASVNSTSFRRPIRVGDVVTVYTGVTYVGRTSLEVGFSVEAKGAEGPSRRVAVGYFTLVKMGLSGPEPIEKKAPGKPGAEERKAESLEEARALRGVGSIDLAERIPMYSRLL